MTTANREFQPATALWNRYRPSDAKYAFRAGREREAKAWQAKARSALGRILGLHKIENTALSPRVIERVDKGDYIREKVILRTAPSVSMPVYMLLPKKQSRPMPTVIAFNGHGYGVKDIVGLWEDGSERDEPDGYHKDFGVALCRSGFAVAAPEISCFGERQTDFSYLDSAAGQSSPGTCGHTAFLASHLGLTVLGMRVHDGMRLVDYIQTRKDLDAGRLGAMGISGGGMHTFFSTGIDTRIRACVVSGYYSTFRDTIFAMGHCSCNFVPGLSEFGEMYDLVGLIAPRPMLVEAGSRDPIFPIKAVRSSVTRARKVYECFGVKGAPAVDYFEGRHSISGKKAYAFLAENLS